MTARSVENIKKSENNVSLVCTGNSNFSTGKPVKTATERTGGEKIFMMAECHDCGKEIDIETEEFEQEWIRDVVHTGSGSESNRLLCPDCKAPSENLLHQALSFVRGVVG